MGTVKKLKKMKKTVRNRVRRAQSLRTIQAETGWDRKRTEKELEKVRERVGVGPNTVAKYALYRIPAEEQREQYELMLEEATKKKRVEKERARNIALIVQHAGVTEEEAEAMIDEAHERLGISSRVYARYGFYDLSLEEQANRYAVLKEQIAKKKEQIEQRNKCVDAVMDATGCSRSDAIIRIEAARGKHGISYHDYQHFRMYGKDKGAEVSENPRTPVLVLARNYSTGLSVARSLADSGFRVDLVASAARPKMSDLLRISSAVWESNECVSKKVKDGADEDFLSTVLSYAQEERIVLLPTDDYTASVADLNRDVLSEHFIMPGIAGGVPGSLVHSMDKTVQGEIARRVGFPTAQEWVVSLRKDPLELDPAITYPCYVKPIESITGYKQEMARCDDEESLRSHLTELAEHYANRDILIQEFLEIEEEIDLEGVCADQEVVLPGVVYKRLVAQHDKGVPLAGHFFPFEDLEQEDRERVLALLKEFHYFGMFDLGLLRVNGKLYFNELNLRSGGTNYVYFKSGVNLSAIFVKKALGMALADEELRAAEFGKTYLYEKVAFDDCLHGYLKQEELDRCLEEADIKLIMDEEDPRPWKVYQKQLKEAQKKAERKQKKGVVNGNE